MGRDIHYVIERQDSNGAWQPVLSKTRAIQMSRNPEAFGLTPEQARTALNFGYRDYARFELLSFHEENLSGDGQDDCIASDDLPADASDHALQLLSVPDLHSHGHFTLGELRELVAQKNGNIFPTVEKLMTGREILRDLNILAENPVLTGEILFGPDYDDACRFYPEMTASNHARMARLQQAQDLKPVSGDSFRILIAYDN